MARIVIFRDPFDGKVKHAQQYEEVTAAELDEAITDCQKQLDSLIRAKAEYENFKAEDAANAATADQPATDTTIDASGTPVEAPVDSTAVDVPVEQPVVDAPAPAPTDQLVSTTPVQTEPTPTQITIQ